ncbi:uncharacterized protein LOC127726384 isoform X6 [Mytilus californianus]|uniref:uncharacterized protein LOC127726384 isoform X5 n=1 Tax=Mytilus californianus TaxID=6549 RepID=UPI002245BDBA|nr:uncharacterized protein LOC127726384 isoform X5 [Mytilus californianus]XP_052089739.1 uncharacterized protein LOC127726384 isoform X6 [Mytilus californianus]
MDREDRKRYFIVGSVILEIVTPVFRQRLEKDYKSKGLGSLQDFINSKPVIHILFHLRHKNIQCCVDSANCVNHGPLPLNYSQWDLLYIETPTPGFHHCFCKYSAKATITLDDLDITLTSLILMNCCNLSPNELSLISDLRQFKNNYLSHNTKGAITQAEYTTLFGDLTTYVLQLDPSKQDDFIRIQNRSLDDSLCNKYVVFLLEIHQKLEEIDTRIQNIGATTADIHSTSTEILSTMNINNAELKAKLEEVLQQLIKNQTNKQVDQPNKPYILGQSIFILHHEINLTLVVDGLVGFVSDMMMMDDGRLVMCLPLEHRLLICNTDGSQVDSVDVQGIPYSVTAVNNSTVAVTLLGSECIEMYDINNKLKLKSISVLCWWRDITTINNKLVVGGYNRLLIIDHQTGKMVQTIQTECRPHRLHGSGEKIFYCDTYNNKLYWYSYTDDSHNTLTLPSPPESMTTLQDGSLYVMCDDRPVKHVSSDGTKYKTVKTKGLKSILFSGSLYYNCKQRKLVTCYSVPYINIFHVK